MRGRVKVTIAAALIFAAPGPAAAWDYPGHRIVGAIADLVLAQYHPATRERVSDLLELSLPGGLWHKRNLREVAVFPDCAKKGNEPFCGRSPSEEENDYAVRNPHHSAYHFTDVPLQRPAYEAGKAGTEDTDIVQMINYAVAQLRAKKPSEKPDKKGVRLTDGEAVWLLAHLVGDIHQPLHVGAKYFDKECEAVVDPNDVGQPPKFEIGKKVAATMGANLIYLVADAAPAIAPADNLHFFWDGAAVVRAMQSVGLASMEQEFARQLAATPPTEWETTGDPETWAEQWVREIMPLAVEAHDRLNGIRKGTKPSPFPFMGACTWEATLSPEYQDWARQVVRTQLAKAGFRLAALLKAIFDQ